MEKFVIKRIEIGGIKNLSETLSLSLVCEKKRPSSYCKKKVIAIYGPNGAGKSAFIHGIEILKNTLLDESYLLDRISNKYVLNLINKNSRRACIGIDFSAEGKNTRSDFRYEICLAVDNDDSVFIEEEKLTSFSLKFERRASRIIFHSKNGSVLETQFSKTMQVKMENLTKRRSFLNIAMENLDCNFASQSDGTNANRRFVDADKKLMSPLLNAILKMQYFMLKLDNHSTYASDFSSMVKRIYDSDDYNNLNIRTFFDHTKGDTRYIDKELYEEFKTSVKNLSLFIQLFKSDLLGIEIESKENGNVMIANLIFKYDGYSLNEEFESTGIKKLVDLFFFFSQAMHPNNILFVDELDSSINDVYLIKLVEYFQRFSDGQLVFTTHNVSPMDLLKKDKECIAFINSSGKMTYWKQVGSYSPSKLYREGYIKGLPFNLNAVDFGEIFYGKGS